MAARMNSNKLQELIINALDTSILKNKKINCFFAGDGENYEKLILTTSKLKLNKKIKFFGGIDNLLNQKFEEIPGYTS